jgi:REP element-mobilizing transposase RayT
VSFGEIDDGQMVLNQPGKIVADSWDWFIKQYNYLTPDYFIVMPNHFHGIIIMQDQSGDSRIAPTKMPIKRKPLGMLIGAFKTVSTKRINQIRNLAGGVLWQRNYYEHVIRDENELNIVRKYIMENPIRWGYDVENPDGNRKLGIDKLPWSDNEMP